MVKRSQLYKYIICAIAIVLCDYLYVISYRMMETHASLIRLAIGLLGVVLAISVAYISQSNIRLKKVCKLANSYIVVYSLIIGFEIIMTMWSYGYSIKHAMFALTPYLYIYYAYPILYVMAFTKKRRDIFGTVILLFMIILTIKAVSWVLYTYTGRQLFSNLLFQYGTWSRNGSLRVDGGALLGLAFSFFLSKVYTESKKYRYIVASAFIFSFVFFITQFRYQIITLVAELIIVYYLSSKNNNQRTNKRVVLFLAFLVVLSIGGFDYIFKMFSVDSDYGGSTLARLRTVSHYWELMKTKNAFFGLGILYEGNENAYMLMHRLTEWGSNSWHYLEDIGVLGGFFQFGLLTLPLYGGMFASGLNAYKVNRRVNNRYNTLALSAILSYLIISNLALNIFDLQRAFAVPFYIAAFSWAYYCAVDEIGEEQYEEKGDVGLWH